MSQSCNEPDQQVTELQSNRATEPVALSTRTLKPQDHPVADSDHRVEEEAVTTKPIETVLASGGRDRSEARSFGNAKRIKRECGNPEKVPMANFLHTSTASKTSLEPTSVNQPIEIKLDSQRYKHEDSSGEHIPVLADTCRHLI